VKILILDGNHEEDVDLIDISSNILSKAQDDFFEITNISLFEKTVSPCRGCFNCWIKTPGECVMDDFGRELNRLFVNNDLIIFIGPVFHGCHSTAIKKVFDRSIPFLQPFFRKVNGEVHHKMRYAKDLDIIFIGIIEERDETQEATFRELSARNAVNFGVDEHRVLFHCREDDPTELIDEAVAIIREFSR